LFGREQATVGEKKCKKKQNKTGAMTLGGGGGGVGGVMI